MWEQWPNITGSSLGWNNNGSLWKSLCVHVPSVPCEWWGTSQPRFWILRCEEVVVGLVQPAWPCCCNHGKSEFVQSLHSLKSSGRPYSPPLSPLTLKTTRLLEAVLTEFYHPRKFLRIVDLSSQCVLHSDQGFLYLLICTALSDSECWEGMVLSCHGD